MTGPAMGVSRLRAAGPVGLVLRADLRLRWRSVLGLALLLGPIAGSAGVAGDASIPPPLLLLAVPAALLAAALIAAGPGWAAARTRPAAILRAE